MATGQTKLAAMINPKVMADMISAALKDQIRFAPLASVNTDLVGRPGSKLAFPSWKYIGDATIVAEGQPIPLDQMAASEKEVEVKKAAKGVEITDEAALSGLGDPIGEATKQLAMAITKKVDDDLITAALETTQTFEVATDAGFKVAALEAGLAIFDDEDQEPIALLINPADAATLRADAQANHMLGSDVGANQFINGTYGDVLGVSIVRSRKVAKGAPILVKQGALALVLKRDVAVESDRDIVKKTTVITADEHYAAYLYNAAKAVKFTTALE